MRRTIALLALALLAGCSDAHLDWVKERAEARFAALGFQVVGYEGWNYGYREVFNPDRGGAVV